MTATPKRIAKDSSEQNDSVVIEASNDWLKCYLTPAEREAAAAALVDAMENMRRKEEEFAAIKAQFKGEISQTESVIQAKKNLVRDGYEFRDVPIEKRIDYEKGTVTVTRLDTLETITSRELTESEKQRKLPGMKML